MTQDQARFDAIREILTALRMRQRVRNTAYLAQRGIFGGALVAMCAAAALAVSRPDWALAGTWLSLLCIPVVALVAGVVGAVWPIDDLALARALDRAADSGDRFASAFQLVRHHRHDRVSLIAEDALRKIEGKRAGDALPMGSPRELRWAPLPVLVVFVLAWLVPGARVAAQDAPDVTPEEWASISREFREDLAEFEQPKTDEEKELAQRLEQIAKMLENQPTKKEALTQLAELQAELEQRRANNGARDFSMRQAANSMQNSTALSRVAEALRTGNYETAADEMKSLADKLAGEQDQLTAEEFEAAASDLERLAQETKTIDEISQACKKCANAANSMNRKKLSDELKKFSECMKRNADKMKQCDKICRACNSLNRLKDRLSKCGNCKNGSCGNFVRNSNKKGGERAGWGTADKWDGGALAKNDEERLPDMVEPQENSGETTALRTVSPDERAQSVQNYKEVYAEMIRKAEADVALEQVPASYREYLRRYFVAIRPQDAAETATDDSANK